MIDRTRRIRQVKKRRRVSTRGRHAAAYADLLNEIFEHVDDVEIGTKLFLWVRSSDTKQEKRRSHIDQSEFVQTEADFGFCEVVGKPCIHIETGKRCLQHERSLRQVTQLAREHCADAMGAESVCRFIRNQDFDFTKNRDLLPTLDDLKWLREVTDGIRLVTMLPPNAPPEFVRNHQRVGRGQDKNRGGRPRKSQRRIKERVRFYHQFHGIQNRCEIARLVGVDESTVRRCLKTC